MQVLAGVGSLEARLRSALISARAHSRHLIRKLRPTGTNAPCCPLIIASSHRRRTMTGLAPPGGRPASGQRSRQGWRHEAGPHDNIGAAFAFQARRGARCKEEGGGKRCISRAFVACLQAAACPTAEVVTGKSFHGPRWTEKSFFANLTQIESEIVTMFARRELIQ